MANHVHSKGGSKSPRKSAVDFLGHVQGTFCFSELGLQPE